MSDDVYMRLREFLDELPGGYPQTESGVEIKILKKLFTTREAQMEMHLSSAPEPVAAIAERAGMEEPEAAEMLESMAKQGLIYRVRINEQPFYMAIQFIVGIYEFHLNSMDREFAQLFEEYFPYLGELWKPIDTKQLRIVPVGKAVDDIPAIAPYDSIRTLVSNQEYIAVAPCICRKERGLLGNQCNRLHETCLTFSFAAQYYVENGLGRRIDVDEAWKILDLAEESALVLAPTNAKEITNICCCCECCCGVLRLLRLDGRPADRVQSSFYARIDPDICAGCETCLERCQIEAIKEGDEAMEVDLARCIGCGLCVTTCPEQAISLAQKEEVHVPPENIMETMSRIATERGLA